MPKKQTAEAGTKPPKPKKPRASKKLPDANGYSEALIGRRFTHRKRSEWGIGTVVGGAENALVLLWGDGTERRTARSYVDQLVDVP